MVYYVHIFVFNLYVSLSVEVYMFTLVFILRLLKHLGILLFISLPLQLIGMILLGIYLPIHFKLMQVGLRKSIKLPYLLRWFDNADLYTDRDTRTYMSQIGVSTFNAWYWLTVRNPCNYFGYCVLGVQISDELSYGTEFQIIPTEDKTLLVGDGYGDTAGFRYTELSVHGKKYYEYYWIHKFVYGDHINCIRFRMGYKIKSIRQLTLNEWAEQVLVLQITRYEGI